MSIRAELPTQAPAKGPARGRVPWAAAVSALLVSLNLRPAVTSVAAAFPALASVFGPAYAPGSPWLAALGSAPILAFGLSAPLGPWLARRWGLAPALTTSMLALAAALALRVASPALLLPGTVIAGCAIMVGSVLVPQLVKANGGATWLAGITTMGMGSGAAIGAALLTPTATWWGLPGALGAWALPAIAAGAVAWATLRPRQTSAPGGAPDGDAAPPLETAARVPRGAHDGGASVARDGASPSSAAAPLPARGQDAIACAEAASSSAAAPLRARGQDAIACAEAPPSSAATRAPHPGAIARTTVAPSSSVGAPPRGRLLRNRTALAITAYFGVQALLYFAVTSWLPTYLADRGANAEAASGLLAWFSVAGLPASFVVPMIVGRRRGARIVGPGIGLAIGACLVWVLAGPLSIMPIAIAALGFSQASTLAFAFTLIVIRSHDAATAGRLSALAQGAGFALASIGPFAAGWAHGATGGWVAPFAGMAVAAVVLAGLGALAVRGPEVR
ncbi:MFS transporter [Sinomonas sp. ASV322]|uniref:MFS transporter n=1 Tax=Sinomonas sp. ASV322 TaxID=3041920 RepID=UPI0027DC68BD|nr:MFS transporter [Sinomonas sp. ASV322]MDQ4503408.1 MFS transporter [Sinomonas sp. ASV322]